MAILSVTRAPILNTRAQVLVLPVNTAGILLDPILMRTQTLYADNYRQYRRACLESWLTTGSCLMHKRQREHAGLGASSNGNQPQYIANLTIARHPYHDPKMVWLNAALMDLKQQLTKLIRYDGVRRIAIFARPLLSLCSNDSVIAADAIENAASEMEDTALSASDTAVLALFDELKDVPRLRIDIHLPRLPTLSA
ncbi:hypothetical protein [Psychrobacter aestuarii]|uniref:Uncharacterized protein n=1 Tax=Psychrobacter aestuarii TaxID=556327 RepID=A0ABP3FT56_9GAMM|nr:hypothetical protein [Psychrobacter aestuarii]